MLSNLNATSTILLKSTVAAAFAATVTWMPNSDAAPKTTLTVATGYADAGRLDPHLSSAGQDKAIISWMFNGLVRIEPGRASPEFIEPDLATEWTSNTARTVWTFKLREGVECHGGYGELTSEDVVYSLNRAADPERSNFSGDFDAFKSIEALDAYTVQITLDHPIPAFLGVLSGYHGGNIVCKKAAETMGENFHREPIGTGPFLFEEYKPQQYVRLVANDSYYRGEPELTEIVYRYIPSDASRDLAFQSGEVDMIFGKQDETWINRIRQLPGASVVVMEPAELNTLHLNMSLHPLDDRRVRKAIAHAVNREALVTFFGETANRPAKSIVPIGYLGHADMDLPAYDPSKARELLADAGYPNGITIEAIQSTFPPLMNIMEIVQEQLRDVSINLELVPVDHATWHGQIRQDLSQVVLYQAARFPVADSYLSQFYHSSSTVGTPDGITNFSHCAAADDKIERARMESDESQQLALWTEAQRQIVDEMCGIPLFESLVLWAYKDDLELGYELRGALNLAPPITERTHFTD